MALRGRLKAAPRGRLTAYWPVLGALITWAVGVSVYLATGHAGVFGIGYGDVTAAIAGRLGLLAIGLLFIGKIVATSGAVGTGGCGGIFAPSLFIGAMAGAGVADLGSLFLNLVPGEYSMLTMIGMAASLGAVIRTPFTCILLIFEVTHQWTVVPGLALAVVVSQGIAHLINRHDMYDEILRQDGVDPNQVLPPRHFKRWQEIPVSALASFRPVVARGLDPASLRELLAGSRHQYFPVVDESGKVTGVLARRDAEMAASGGVQPKIEPAQWISAKTTVGSARKTLLAGASDFLCVGEASEGVVRGVLTLHDLLRGESVLEDDAQS